MSSGGGAPILNYHPGDYCGTRLGNNTPISYPPHPLYMAFSFIKVSAAQDFLPILKGGPTTSPLYLAFSFIKVSAVQDFLPILKGEFSTFNSIDIKFSVLLKCQLLKIY